MFKNFGRNAVYFIIILLTGQFFVGSREDYATLGVEFGASQGEVKKAYRTLILRYHPDKQAHKTEDKKKEADEMTKKINASRDAIMNGGIQAEDKMERKSRDEKGMKTREKDKDKAGKKRLKKQEEERTEAQLHDFSTQLIKLVTQMNLKIFFEPKEIQVGGLLFDSNLRCTNSGRDNIRISPKILEMLPNSIDLNDLSDLTKSTKSTDFFGIDFFVSLAEKNRGRLKDIIH